MDPLPEVKKRLLRFLNELTASGGNISAACKNMGITRQGYYRWMRQEYVIQIGDEEMLFQDAVESVMEESTDNVESALYKSALDGQVAAQIFWLKNRGKKRGWSDNYVQDQTLRMSDEIDYSRLDDETLRKIAALDEEQDTA